MFLKHKAPLIYIYKFKSLQIKIILKKFGNMKKMLYLCKILEKRCDDAPFMNLIEYER